ncbi:NUDIX hydrolase [Mucilaginibacter myungsuensis]|uniref:NUDIX hydrolase n=1 Tax=Mucilaginibacter myungsuensis TaxID=649104 RepID=A0A929L4Z3_9SPHI|nr:NUDIX domain-containing protein [Mucilaginibacter myungsuensis]MBE9664559.1 NUDIX hydrolase [Mucilaginibacter myungsuensis]MDN3601091.1 NUDIX domain-containing protein [Mucilaginibacter myungsuensis]
MYPEQERFLLATDCIIFGFDGSTIKLLLIQRGMEPMKNHWSLMGGFVKRTETTDDAANRILQQLTGLQNVYLEQLHVFGKPDRDPVERTLSVAYFALIDINKYAKQITTDHNAEWFGLNELPELIFDHTEMVKMAKKQLRYKAALHPILFQLLPEKFTIPQLQVLYQGIYQSKLDDRNFSRKVLSTNLLIKLPEKEKLSSKKGAFYYKLNQSNYLENFEAFLNFIPNPDRFFKD